MAVAVSGKYISDNDLQQVEELVRNCPEGALSIVEEVLNMSKQDFVKNAVKQLESIDELGKPKSSDFSFISSDYLLSTGFPNGEGDYIYSTRDKAIKAALQEFDRIAYSQIKVMALNVLTMYKSKCLAPYYNLDSPNLYDENNKKIENILKEINGRYKALFGESLGYEFETFEAYPDRDSNSTLRGLYKNEYFAPTLASKVEKKMNAEYPISQYSCYCYINDREVWEEKGAFGREKYVRRYCYNSIENAVDHLKENVISNVSYTDCQASAHDFACLLIYQYNYNMKKEIRERIDILKRLK